MATVHVPRDMTSKGPICSTDLLMPIRVPVFALLAEAYSRVTISRPA